MHARKANSSVRGLISTSRSTCLARTAGCQNHSSRGDVGGQGVCDSGWSHVRHRCEGSKTHLHGGLCIPVAAAGSMLPVPGQHGQRPQEQQRCQQERQRHGCRQAFRSQPQQLPQDAPDVPLPSHALLHRRLLPWSSKCTAAGRMRSTRLVLRPSERKAKGTPEETGTGAAMPGRTRRRWRRSCREWPRCHYAAGCA